MRELVCDKCGKPVSPENDAVRIDLFIRPNISLVVAQPRHLLPEGECPGSPSRAQYLPGQPRDPRYPYDDAKEPRVRAAYAAMQETTTP